MDDHLLNAEIFQPALGRTIFCAEEIVLFPMNELSPW